MGVFLTCLICKIIATVFYVACLFKYKAPPPSAMEIVGETIGRNPTVLSLAKGIEQEKKWNRAGAENKAFQTDGVIEQRQTSKLEDDSFNTKF